MSKVGADDYATRPGATVQDFQDLPRTELPPLIHLVDIERTEYVGRTIQTDIVIAGVGETFHVPSAWTVDCSKSKKKSTRSACPVCPRMVALGSNKALLNFCRMSDDQVRGTMRLLSGCRNRPTPIVTAMSTITEILAVPTASGGMESPGRDYREKVVALIGTMQNSNIRYRATGEVIAEPKRQRASLLVSNLSRLQSAADGFVLTEPLRERFRAFQVVASHKVDPLETAGAQVARLTRDITQHITKIYGTRRECILLTALLVLHSPATILWSGEEIKGVVDALVIGDTGQGKSTQVRRLMSATGVGHFTSGSTSSRAGILYSLDSKVNDKRILRWGAFPLAHGEALVLDEAQNVSREQWSEFTTARSEGLLKVDRSIRAEHPCRVRLLAFANPVTRAQMAAFQYGIMAVHPSFGFLTHQDLRRFDVVACVAEGDQRLQDIDQARTETSADSLVPADLLRESILWVWTRRFSDCHYAAGAEAAIMKLATALSEKLGTPEIPLLITDAPEKVARLAFAYASLLHSTDDRHEHVIVTPVHVGLVGRYLEAVYMHPNCAFDQYAAVLRRRGGLTGRVPHHHRGPAHAWLKSGGPARNRVDAGVVPDRG
jgi:hypothetical protein